MRATSRGPRRPRGGSPALHRRLRLDAGLRELSLGEFEGAHSDDVLAAAPGFLVDPDAALPGGESIRDVDAGRDRPSTGSWPATTATTWSSSRTADLVYSRGALGFDPSTANATYRVASSLTGGSSGGPWFTPFSAGSGTMMSVNSYGYSGVTAMHGPKLNAETQAMFNTAASATTNTIVP